MPARDRVPPPRVRWIVAQEQVTYSSQRAVRVARNRVNAAVDCIEGVIDCIEGAIDDIDDELEWASGPVRLTIHVVLLMR